jgi:hypothetical protein
MRPAGIRFRVEGHALRRDLGVPGRLDGPCHADRAEQLLGVDQSRRAHEGQSRRGKSGGVGPDPAVQADRQHLEGRGGRRPGGIEARYRAEQSRNRVIRGDGIDLALHGGSQRLDRPVELPRPEHKVQARIAKAGNGLPEGNRHLHIQQKLTCDLAGLPVQPRAGEQRLVPLQSHGAAFKVEGSRPSSPHLSGAGMARAGPSGSPPAVKQPELAMETTYGRCFRPRSPCPA